MNYNAELLFKKISCIMNTKLALLLFFSAIFLGCGKSDDEKTTFVKKVLVEEFTGEWCGSCPYGAQKIKEFKDLYSKDAICICMHINDPYQLEYAIPASDLLTSFNIPYVPSALVNRTFDENKDWVLQVKSNIGLTALAGIKIDSKIVNNLLDIDITCMADSDMKNVLLTVYLVEDNVPQSSPGAQVNGTLDYIHENVLRRELTAVFGDPISLTANQEYLKKFYDINIAGFKTKDLKIVAVLNKEINDILSMINTNFVEAGGNVGW